MRPVCLLLIYLGCIKNTPQEINGVLRNWIEQKEVWVTLKRSLSKSAAAMPTTSLNSNQGFTGFSASPKPKVPEGSIHQRQQSPSCRKYPKHKSKLIHRILNSKPFAPAATADKMLIKFPQLFELSIFPQES